MDPRIILLARAYARQLARGDTAPEAREYISTRFGPASDAQVSQAVYQAQRALDITERLQGMRNTPGALLSYGCPGDWDCTQSVGVGVRVTFTKADGSGESQMAYFNMEWYNTIANVEDRVAATAAAYRNRTRYEVSFTWEFQGPIGWPAQ